MIRLQTISLLRQGKRLLENASVIIHSGQHVGLVGANGAGKSSLLALLTHDLHPDTGDLTIDAGRGIAHMSQEVLALDREAIEYVLDGDEPLRTIEQALAEAEASQQYEKTAELHDQYLSADGYTARARAEQLLVGLGFAHQDVRKSARDFSGGWRMRLNLARTLMSPADILLLDEPTNHLDLDAIVWLESYLKGFQGTLVVISHDRDFLDAVTDHTLHIEHNALTKYRGGYSAFERLRAGRLEQQQAVYEKQQQQRDHMQRFVDRFRAKATKAKQVQSRLKALERLGESAPAHTDSPFSFSFPEAEKQSSPLLTLDRASLGYGGKELLKAKLSILPGNRIGLLGVNGAGKSTLIKSLVGDLPLIAGERHQGEHLKTGYFAQHQLESLDIHASPLLHLQRLSPDAREQTLRHFLGGFGFIGDKALETIEGFSGGEKARLALAIIAWQKPNLLLLDEPTNHLDLDMRYALTVALQSFTGAVIIVSHDRNLIRNTADVLLLVDDGKVTEFAGDIEDYSDWLIKQRLLMSNNSVPANASVPAANSAQAKKAQKRQQAERRKALRPLKLTLEKAEKTIDTLNMSLNSVEKKLSDPSIYDQVNKAALKELLDQQTVLKKTLAEAEDAWMALQEQWEVANGENGENGE
ncbi:ribosomal protection-like ABC-F family protein [Candidatus Sororendozoicomonas aggregata]|uniref:ribosomal protection-like ABC-F family protein n=1 Tax=Candidatus Sororendozoicomonas aggregata TaxID=3073239 RepID=UPI002ED20A6F